MSHYEEDGDSTLSMNILPSNSFAKQLRENLRSEVSKTALVNALVQFSEGVLDVSLAKKESNWFINLFMEY